MSKIYLHPELNLKVPWGGIVQTKTFTETICMQQEYVRMKCLSKAFCIHLVRLCVSALNHCTLNRLLKMFVLLPTATISRHKMTFIFLMCAYTLLTIQSVYFIQ